MRVLIVHASAELYGSDRSLLDFVRLRPSGLEACVALPEDGPLVAALRAAGAEVVLGDVGKLRSDMKTPAGALRALRSTLRSQRFLGALHRARPFDLVYSNSIAIVGGALAARRWGLPHVWHVREIVADSPGLAGVFRWMVHRGAERVLCNSDETRAWIGGAGQGRYITVWNGYDAPAHQPPQAQAREALGLPADGLLVVMVGRVNRWKGQGLLVRAFAAAQARATTPMRLLLLGSAAEGQQVHEQALAQDVAASGCADRIHVQPFRPDVELAWVAADLAVVPSTEPEPFGRVAVEAMAFGKPVIAAAHGGLVEIVDPGETGLLVAPRDVAALENALVRMADDAALRTRMGSAGLARQRSQFSLARYAQAVSEHLAQAATRSPLGPSEVLS
jgi:glycosyltransferase involved in cell wall biosynthesis